jgi:hypothetical protein
MRPSGDALRYGHQDFIGEAPQPVLTGLEGTRDLVPDLVRVPMGMPVLRGIAAPHLAAGHAHPKMHPRVTESDALRAALRAAHNVPYLAKVRAHVPAAAQPLNGESEI